MKSFISLVIFCLLTVASYHVFGQAVFSFTAKYHENYHPLDSVLIENIITGSTLVKYFPDTILQILPSGVEEIEKQGEPEFCLNQNYPNPYTEKTIFAIYLPEYEKLSIGVFTISGKQVIHFEQNMLPGNHSFLFTGNEEKQYLLFAKTGHFSAAIQLLNPGDLGNVKSSLEYIGYRFETMDKFKKNNKEFLYTLGDTLKIIGFITNDSGKVISDTIIDEPTESKTFLFHFEKTFRIAILMYHELVEDEPENEYQRNITDFENDLVFLRDNNYQVLSMEDLLLIPAGDLELVSDGVIITFDDGYNSDYTKALPLLKKYEIPATFFIVPEWIGTQDYMTWAEIWLISDYMNTKGKKSYSIGSHTSSHPYLEKSAEYFTNHQDYLDFLNTELGDSKNWIVDITGQTTIFLSLPFGDGANNSDIIQTAVDIGYKGIRTSIWNSFSVEEMNLFALPAIPVLNNTSIVEIENYLNQTQ